MAPTEPPVIAATFLEFPKTIVIMITMHNNNDRNNNNYSN